MDDLFRKEAIEHQKSRLEGEVVIAAPRTDLWLTLLLLLVVASAAALLLTASYARKETVPGFLVSSLGTARILVPERGTVTEVFVQEGDRVAEGAPLLRIRHERQVSGGESTQAQALEALDRRSREIARQIALEDDGLAAQKATTRQRVASLEDQIAQLRRRHDSQNEMVAMAQEDVDRLATLAEQGVASERTLRERRQILVGYQRDEAELAQDIAMLRGQVDEQLQEEVRSEIATQRGISELQAELFSIDERRARIESERFTLITAPVAGEIAALYAALGQDIDAGVSPLSILPAGGKLQAELYVPTRAAGFIKQGQEAQLLYDAFPYERFGTFPGTVERITTTVVSPTDAPGPLEITEPVYRVKIRLDDQTIDADGEAIRLQAGMVLRANIILERQPLLTWVVAPINSLSLGL